MTDQVMKQIHDMVQGLDDQSPENVMKNWNEACEAVALQFEAMGLESSAVFARSRKVREDG